MKVRNPHFAFPFTRETVVEQDTAEHVMACVQVIARCPVGFRQERPDFGWPHPHFRTIPVDVAPLEEALRRFEPRADYTLREYRDVLEASTSIIDVEVESDG